MSRVMGTTIQKIKREIDHSLPPRKLSGAAAQFAK